MSMKPSHRKFNSDEFKLSRSRLNSFSPDPYIITFKSEIQKALDYLKKNQIPKIEKSLEKSPILRLRNRGENMIKSFVEAIFSNEQSIYRKSDVSLDLQNTDMISADKLLQEAKRIIKNGIKKKITQHIGDNLEYF